MTPSENYIAKCREILDLVERQSSEIARAADWFAAAILDARVVHVFGSGHSRIAVEEMWPRYGSFPGFHPIVELSLTFHNQVVGANGQRQAMFLENTAGLGAKILRNFHLSSRDAGLVISSSGCNVVPIEVAEGLRAAGMKVVAIVSRAHSEASASRHPRGLKLSEIADLVLDTGAPAGDAMVTLDALDAPVSPGSTIGSVALVNAVKAEVAARLAAAGKPPPVLAAGCVVGTERAAKLFDAAYDEHAERVSALYQGLSEAYGTDGDA